MKKKNVIKWILLVIGVGLLLYYAYLWYDAYQENKVNTPIMNKYLVQINYNELAEYTTESKNAIIYTSVLDNETIRKFEKKFKRVIIDNQLRDKILYLDISDENYQDLKEIYNKNGISITDVPNIMVFKDGDLDMIYSIKDNDYNIDNVQRFLQQYDLIEAVE